MYNMSNKIVDYLCKLSDKNDVHWIYKNYSFFNTGNTAIIMFDKERKSVWKFSPNINEEARLLKKLNNPEYVVKIKGEPQEDIAIELEYIKGNSLEKMIEEQKLSNTRVLKYSSGIMKGLVEMRKAGIYYHRDIRPANVLIDEEKDRAVICDLGIATEDKGAKPLENKRYGPAGDKANDLFSLGLLTYKMATGSHLFADSPEMERNVDRVYNEIKNADNDPYLFNDYITKVEKNVSNDSSGKKIKSVIKACLTAQNNEHEKMQEMFKEYTK
jgi:serine/threonine protein kinase